MGYPPSRCSAQDALEAAECTSPSGTSAFETHAAERGGAALGRCHGHAGLRLEVVAAVDPAAPDPALASALFRAAVAASPVAFGSAHEPFRKRIAALSRLGKRVEVTVDEGGRGVAPRLATEEEEGESYMGQFHSRRDTRRATHGGPWIERRAASS